MAEVLNEKLPTFLELLKKANESNDPVSVLKQGMDKDQRVLTVLGYAMNPNFKMGMPDGTPPYIPGDSPLGLAEIEILHLANKLYVLYDNKMPKAKKEQTYIQWLEKMNEDEAKLMILIKDKKLHEAHQNLTEDVFIAALGWSKEQYENLKKKASAT